MKLSSYCYRTWVKEFQFFSFHNGGQKLSFDILPKDIFPTQLHFIWVKSMSLIICTIDANVVFQTMLWFQFLSHDLELIIFQHRKYIVIICLTIGGGLCCSTMCLPTFFWGRIWWNEIYICTFLKIKSHQKTKKNIMKIVTFLHFFQKCSHNILKTWFHCWAIPKHG